MRILCKVWLFYLYFRMVGGSSAYADPLVLNENRTYSLAGHLEVLLDPSTQLTFTDMLTPELNQLFKPIPGFFTHDYGNLAIWLRFRVRRTGGFPPESFMVFAPPVLDFLTVHVQTGGNADSPDAYQMFRLGDHIPVKEGHRYQPDFVAPLTISEGQDYRVYVRLQTTSALTLTGSIKPEEILVSDNNTTIILQAAWLTVYLFIAGMALLFWVRLRERLYGYFALYLLALFVNRVSAAGMLPLIFPDYAHRMSDAAVSVSGCGLWVFLVLFSWRLYEEDLTRLTRQIFRLLLAITCGALLLLPIFPWGRLLQTDFMVGLFLFSFCIWLSHRQIRRGVRISWLYALSYVAMIMGSFIELLRVSGIIPLIFWNINTIQIATFSNILLLAAALAEKLRQDQKNAFLAERNAKQHAQEMAEDMTVELRQKQQDLEQTLERQSRFVSMVSHEYRTPLSIIRTNLDLLSKKKHDPDGTLAFAVNKMKRAISRLVEVMEINLDKAKFADDSFKLRRETFELMDLVAEVIHLATEFWPDRSLVLVHQDTDIMLVSADWRLLKTVLLNVLDNAVKYSPKEGAVEIAVSCGSGEAVIDVTDHGLGIPPVECQKVFEKNYRIPGNQAIVGSGLGLYLVARIVAEHRGSVAIHSGGFGTTVTIRLPVVQT